MNFVTAELVRNGGPAVAFAGFKLPVPAAVVAGKPGLDEYFGKKVILGIRPSDFEDEGPGGSVSHVKRSGSLENRINVPNARFFTRYAQNPGEDVSLRTRPTRRPSTTTTSSSRSRTACPAQPAASPGTAG
jgi:hypothetical protein